MVRWAALADLFIDFDFSGFARRHALPHLFFFSGFALAHALARALDFSGFARRHALARALNISRFSRRYSLSFDFLFSLSLYGINHPI